jgi:hypothetical protein
LLSRRRRCSRGHHRDRTVAIGTRGARLTTWRERAITGFIAFDRCHIGLLWPRLATRRLRRTLVS